MCYARILTLLGLFLIATDVSSASCRKVDADRTLNDYETVFVAFLTEGRFVEGEGPGDCGWVEGSFDVVEEFQGFADSVTVLKKRLRNCKGQRVGGYSDSIPIGKYVLVRANSETAALTSCTPVWADQETSCLLDDIRRRLDIQAVDFERRDWCIRNEESGGQLKREMTIREEIDRLESDREALEIDLKELKEMLEDSGSSQ